MFGGFNFGGQGFPKNHLDDSDDGTFSFYLDEQNGGG